MANFVLQFTVMETFHCWTYFIFTLFSSVREGSPFPGLPGPGVGWHDIGIMLCWREMGLHTSDGQEKISCRDHCVCKDPFAGFASHPSLLADAASKERGSRPSIVEEVFSWSAAGPGRRAIFVPRLCP